MLAQIDNFPFELTKTSYNKLTRALSYSYATINRIGNYDLHQAVGKHEENITLSGTLLLKKQSQLDALEELAAQKKEVTLSLASGRAKRVIAKSLTLDRESFLRDGLFLKQDFSLDITVVGGQ